jgi:hypothetical protein
MTEILRRCASLFIAVLSISFVHTARAEEAPPAPAPADTAAPTTAPTTEPSPVAPAPAETAAPVAPAPPPPQSTAPGEAAPAEAPAAPTPPPYSLPWQLRPASAGTAVRLDTAFAFYEDPTSHKSGSVIVPMASFSYKVVKGFAPILRLGLSSNSPPDAPAPAGDSGVAFLNPVLGATYSLELSPELRLAFFLGLTVPVGSGGGDKPDVATANALKTGIPARSAMDNAMFAVDYFTIFPGVDFAFVSGGFTAQAEATLFQLGRVRGSADPTTDPSRTNLTMGFHAGYFVIPLISIGAEIRHQRWLSTPKAVTANATARDTTTIAIGPRFHFQVSKGKWLRPGIAFAFPLDDPMKKSSYKIVQLDIPFSF